jgi:hypothetical protein
MADTPSPHELARDIAQLEQARHNDLAALRQEIRDLGDRLERRLDGLTAVSQSTFHADQARQDDAIASVKGDVISLRKIFVGGLLTVIAAAVVVPLVTSM